MQLANGYETITTFDMDFSIADKFGIDAIKDTFNRAFKMWKNNIEYVTELCIIMNLKCWEHYHLGNMEISQMYSEYYYKVKDYVYEHYTDKKDLQYFFNCTD